MNQFKLHLSRTLRIGVFSLIAQELEAVAPKCVKTESTGVKTVDSDELFWHMLNSIKELSAKVAELESRLGE